jgi:hypothetical protein
MSKESVLHAKLSQQKGALLRSGLFLLLLSVISMSAYADAEIDRLERLEKGLLKISDRSRGQHLSCVANLAEEYGIDLCQKVRSACIRDGHQDYDMLHFWWSMEIVHRGGAHLLDTTNYWHYSPPERP